MILGLDQNQIVDISPLSSLTHLTSLGLNQNQIRDIHSILSLTNLANLYLHGNHFLTSLPNEILTFNPDCHIHLQNCGLSNATITRLQDAINAPGYSGPNIHLAIIQPVEEDTRSDSEIIQSLYQEIGKEEDYQERTYDLGNAFSPWLRRLNFMKDFQTGGETKRILAKNVIKYLELTHNNASFKDVFQHVVSEAIQTCGDRMSLSILYLGIQYQLATTDLSDVQKVINLLLRGCGL